MTAPRCSVCRENPGTERFGNGLICEGCIPGGDDGADGQTVESGVYPAAIREREWWVTWILDGVERKRPVAPWQTGHAYPVEWRGELDSEDRPETDFETAKRWVDFRLSDLGLSLPPDALSEQLRLGIILPVDRPPRGERVVLIDWDDVRDPETGEIHPVAVEFIERYGGYVEVSRSGEGLHQFVYGGLRHRDKFIAPIDTEPFVGEDLPQVEIYDGGRHVAMTGDHLASSGEDVVDGQDCIDEIVREYASAEMDAGHRTYDPATGATPTDAEQGESDGADAPVPEPEPAEYDGPPVDELRASKPTDRSLAYHAVVEAFCEGFADVLNWRLEGAAAALGQREDRTAGEVIDDLRGAGREDGSVGYDKKTPGRVKYDHARAARGEFSPAAWETLASWGVLPAEFVEEVTSDDTEPAAVLPPAVRDLTGETERLEVAHADGRTTMTMDSARARTVREISEALRNGEHALVEALPTLGKSHGSILAAAGKGTPMALRDTVPAVTVLTPRGNVEQYEQIRQWCDGAGMSHYTLPSFYRDCPTANGEHGEGWERQVKKWRARGATPKAIHANAERFVDEELPCQDEGTCAYTRQWDFDPAEYDVLIGHPVHAYKDKVINGRGVLIDEFPRGDYEITLNNRLEGAVSHYLDATPEIPFDDYTELIEDRDDDDRREEAVAYLEQHLEPDELLPFVDRSGHAAAPLATYTLLAAKDFGNGWEAAELEDGAIGAYDRSNSAVHLLQPPLFFNAEAVVALDGTPTPAMWNLALGTNLRRRRVLDDGERARYLRHVLGHKYVRTTEWVKPYNNDQYVNVDEDAALLEAIGEHHGERPAVITTATAEDVYAAEGVDDLYTESKHYGNLLGSNEFKETRLGAVIGSTHYGDGFIKKWGAYADEAVERGDGKGADLTYGDFGNEVLNHMREHETLQAAMRFGRDGEGATVYVHTDTLPSWVPIAAEGRVVRTRSDGERDVMAAAENRAEWTTAELAEDVDLTQRQVFNVLDRFAEDGVVAREYEGDGYVWRDDGLHEVSDHGEVDLEPVGVEELSEKQTQEVARSSSYTWRFLSSAAAAGSDTEKGGESSAPGHATAPDGGLDPPDHA